MPVFQAGDIVRPVASVITSNGVHVGEIAKATVKKYWPGNVYDGAKITLGKAVSKNGSTLYYTDGNQPYSRSFVLVSARGTAQEEEDDYDIF